MRKILLLGLLLLGLNTFSQNTVTQKLVRVTQKLTVDDTLKYNTSIIPLLDVAYTQYSVDSTSWHKTYTFADKYIRVSNDIKSTWMIMKILKNGIQRSDSLTVFATPKSVRDAVIAVVINTDSLVHKGRTETLIGKKTFNKDVTTLKRFIGTGETLTKDTSVFVLSVVNTNSIGGGIESTSTFLGIEGRGTDPYDSYGISGQAYKIPVLGTNYSTTGTGRKTIFSLRGNSAYTSVQNDYGLTIDWLLPVKGWTDPDLSEKLMGQFSSLISDTTKDVENTRFEWRLMKDGTLTKVMDLSSKGNLTLNNITLNAITAPIDSIGGEIYYGTDGAMRYFNSTTNTWQTMAGEPNLARVYSLTLPSASTVADRCSGAVSGVDYPAGWTIGAYSGNTHDLQIVHNLNKRIVSVTVYSTSGAGDRILINTAAYSGMLAPDKNTLRIEGLATVLTPIVVNITFN